MSITLHSPLGLTVIIPAFNEQATIQSCISRVFDAAARDGWELQLIVVDDGSDDGTAETLDRIAGEKPEIKRLRHTTCQGKGAAIRTAIQHAEMPWIVIQDADLEYNPCDLRLLCDRARDSEPMAVYGSRNLSAAKTVRRRNAFSLGVFVLNHLVRLLYRVELPDEATCYKLFRAEDLRRMDLHCERFEFCPEVTAKACRMGLVIHEVPIRYQPRTRREGKKIRLRDGYEAIRTLWRYRDWTPPLACQSDTDAGR